MEIPDESGDLLQLRLGVARKGQAVHLATQFAQRNGPR